MSSILTSEATLVATVDTTLRTEKGSHLMSPRHTIVMALSSSIGTGLWIGTSRALYFGGPVGLILAYSIVGTMLFILMSNINEMLTLKPNRHGLYGYIKDFGGDALCFAAIINYTLLWLFCFPAELVAATSLIELLSPSEVLPRAAWITLLLFICVTTMFLPAKWYGESEFILGIIKVIALLTCTILVVCIDTGGFKEYTPRQSINWNSGTLFGIGGRGPLLAFVSAGFAMGGIELFTLSVLETTDPRRSAKSNIRAIMLRLGLCYLLTVVLYSTVIFSQTSALNDTTSPIFIALRLALQPALEKLMVVFVLITLMSAANTALYLVSRSFERAIDLGYAPRCFAAHRLPSTTSTSPDASWEPRRTTAPSQVSWSAMLAALAFGSIAFMTTTSIGASAFGYLMGVVAMGNYLTWLLLAIAHARFRYEHARLQRYNTHADVMSDGAGIGLDVNISLARGPNADTGPCLGNPTDRHGGLPYCTYGPWWLRTSYVLLVICVAFVAQFWLAIHPLPYSSSPTTTTTSNSTEARFSWLEFLSATGIIFIFGGLVLGRTLRNASKHRQSFVASECAQVTLVTYLRASAAYRGPLHSPSQTLLAMIQEKA